MALKITVIESFDVGGAHTLKWRVNRGVTSDRCHRWRP